MGFSSEEYIDMCDKMMAELNEAELKKGLHNLFTHGEECYEIEKDGSIKCIDNVDIVNLKNAEIEQQYFSPEEIIKKFNEDER